MPQYQDSGVYDTIVTNDLPTPGPSTPTPTVTPASITCAGDCNRDEAVTVDEIVRVVNIALSGADDCGSIDMDESGSVTVDEILLAVTAGLDGCLPVPTPVPVTFQEIQDSIFTPACRDIGCHNATDRLGSLVLTDGVSYGQLVGVPPSNFAAATNGFLRVDPGNPDNSFLLTKLVNPRPEHGSRMPLNKPPLGADDVDRVHRWILQGALP